VIGLTAEYQPTKECCVRSDGSFRAVQGRDELSERRSREDAEAGSLLGMQSIG